MRSSVFSRVTCTASNLCSDDCRQPPCRRAAVPGSTDPSPAARTYGAARAAFVGGSLAPLGGHNFLEPLLGGILPVIGPYRRAFEWVGTELFRDGLVQEAADWRQAARLLLKILHQPPPRETIRDRATRFCQRRRGGTAQACHVIHEVLKVRRTQPPR